MNWKDAAKEWKEAREALENFWDFVPISIIIGVPLGTLLGLLLVYL